MPSSGTLLAAILLGTLAAAGCSAPHTTGRPRASQSSPHPSPSTSAALATLPDATQMGGTGDAVVVAAEGQGSKSLGTFRVAKNEKIYVQAACDGPPPLTLLPLTDVGPCNDPLVVNVISLHPPSSKITFTVKAKPGLRWRIYVSQRLQT